MTWDNPRALGRLISSIENGEAGSEATLRQLYAETGRAHVIGITGPPGAGKSSLTNKLARLYAEAGKRVGIIAVDPTSPFTGGAILGDRVRMAELATHPNIFIRSMGTRGHLGGLSASTHLVRLALDAAGADIIFIESVGVGQSEVEIVGSADTVLLVMVPGLGDDIQGLKAGILEIGDVFAVNKADLPGADRTKLDIEATLSFMPKRDWQAPIVMVSVKNQSGLEELKAALDSHQSYLNEAGRLAEKREAQLRAMIADLLHEKLYRRARQSVDFDALVRSVQHKDLNPYEAVDRLMEEMK